MKKYIWIFIIILILIGGGLLFYYFSNQNSNNNSNNYNTSRTGYSNNNSSDKTISIQEEEVSSYSTAIKNKVDSGRQQNISLTCSTLNGTEVAPGSTFSFCDTVGPATPERGYNKANIIVDGVELKGYGGGNCQISSTLYNAVLAFGELEVVERHPHSAKVPYIEKGKDAAVSYGSHDFKFKNNSDSTIRIYATNTPDDITIRLVKLVRK